MVVKADAGSRQIINFLTSFVAVVETRSFRRAADLIGKSQPSVTAHIAQLEELLGVPLIARTTRQVTPTAVGDALLTRAKVLIQDSERLVRDFQNQELLMQGRLSVSVSPTVCARLMPRFLGVFQAAHPHVHVSFREDMREEMIKALQVGKAEIGVGPYNRVPETLKFEPLVNQLFFLIMHKNHPLAGSGQVRLQDLENLDLICPPQGMTARDILDQELQRRGIEVSPKHEAAQFITLAGMVSLGLGATVMPLGSRRVLDAFELVALPFADADIIRVVGVLTHNQEPLSPPASAFKEMLFLNSHCEESELLEEGWRMLGKDLPVQVS